MGTSHKSHTEHLKSFDNYTYVADSLSATESVSATQFRAAAEPISWAATTGGIDSGDIRGLERALIVSYRHGRS
jgi:hypothetical protein